MSLSLHLPGPHDRHSNSARVIKSSEEYALFERRFDQFERSLLKWPPPTIGTAEARRTRLVVKRQLERLLGSESPGWAGLIVGVDEGDGMTWAAADVDRQVASIAPQFERRHLTPDRRPDGLPQIVELVPKRTLLRLAQQAGAAPQLPGFRRRWIAAMGVALVLLGAVSTAAAAVMKTRTGLDPLYLILGAASAGVVFLSQEVAGRLKRSERDLAEQRMLGALTDAKGERPDAFKQLASLLREELVRNTKDRLVLVDDFSRLDDLTRETLDQYVVERDSASAARELWVLFEDAELGPLAKAFKTRSTRVRRAMQVRLEIGRQVNLDHDARARLAAEVGLPDRADFRLVKSIVHDTAGLEAYGDLLENEAVTQRPESSGFAALTLAYLLAVDRITGMWAFREADLLTQLSAKGASAHRAVLRLIVPDATLRRGEIDDTLRALKARLARILDRDRPAADEVVLVREAADLMVANRGHYGLPSVSLVHLYWGLYWFSVLVGSKEVNPYALRKLSRHLVAAAAPGALAGDVGTAVRERYVEAALWAARELLAASLPDEVAGLIVRAEREATREEHRRRLRRMAWQAYAVLGSEELLGVILQAQPSTATTAQDPDELERFFVESLRFGDPSSSWRTELARRLPALERDVDAYARARGLWAAMTVDRAVPGSWSQFAHLAREHGASAGQLAREAAQRMIRAGDRRAVTDALTASLGTWCVALAALRGEVTVADANEVLEDVRLRALQLHDDLDRRRAQDRTEDYVLRAFARELEIVAAAAAVAIEATPSAERAPSTERTRLRDHATGAARRRDENASTDVVREMTLQTLTWTALGYSADRPFGFEQLAAFMTIRRVHLQVITGSRSEVAVNLALRALSGQLTQPGTLGLMAHAIAAEASPSNEISAVLWSRAIGMALGSGFGHDLDVELCLATLSIGHSFMTPELAVVTDRLAQNTTGAGASRLGQRLARLENDERRDAALWLMNAADKTSAQQLVNEVRALRDLVDDNSVRDDITQLIELAEIADDLEHERPLAASRILETWEPRRAAGAHYPWMLHLMFRQPDVDDDIIGLASSYLEEHPELPRMTGPLHLALDVATHLRTRVKPGDAELAHCQKVALAYLDRVHPPMQRSLGIDINLRALDTLLYHQTGSATQHRQARDRWEAARQERDGLKKLPPLVEAGKFFLVLWHYYETLRYYGLKTDPVIGADALFGADEDPAVLEEWHARGEPVPDPLSTGAGGLCLSADFLRYGRAVFGSQGGDPDIEDAREGFNAEALQALPILLAQLTSLTSIPERVRGLLVDHRSRLLPRTVPV